MQRHAAFGNGLAQEKLDTPVFLSVRGLVDHSLIAFRDRVSERWQLAAVQLGRHSLMIGTLRRGVA